MRRNCVILIVLVASCVLLSSPGCNKTQKELEAALEAQLSPIIIFKEVVHDFGEVGPEKKNTVEFQFTNAGNGLLKIEEVKACCGITVEELKKKEYAPGESGTMKVEYTSGKLLGSEVKRFHVYSNDKAKPDVALAVKANIVSKVAWEPKSFKLTLAGENTVCPKITISSLDNQPFSITAFKSTLNCITANIDLTVAAARFVLEPKVDATKLTENMKGYVHISITHPEWNTVSIPFDVLSRFTVNPPQIIILDAQERQPVKKYLEVLSNYGELFEVETVSSQNGLIKVLNQKKVDNGYQLELEITPPATDGKQQVFTDTLFVNIKGVEKVMIPCHGFYLVKE